MTIKYVWTDHFLDGPIRLQATVAGPKYRTKCDQPASIPFIERDGVSAEEDEFCRKFLTPVLDVIQWGISDYREYCFAELGDIPERGLTLEIYGRHDHIWRARLSPIKEYDEVRKSLLGSFPTDEFTIQVRLKDKLLGHLYLL